MVNVDYKMFLTTDAVKRAIPPASRKALSRAGGLLRKVAQRSMRYRKKASLAGQPPSAHRERGALLRKLLFFGWDSQAESVVVGPLGFGKNGAALQEFGGRVRVKNPRRRFRKIGDGGEIRISAGVAVYTKLATQAQAHRANRLNRELYGEDFIQVSVPRRPFMKPALDKVSPELPKFYKDMVR